MYGDGKLVIYGSRQTLCDGLTRRDFLHVGGLGAFGLGVSGLLKLQDSQPATSAGSNTFGKAKACILLSPYGSPPQHETFDPKPAAGPRGAAAASCQRRASLSPSPRAPSP